MSELAQVKVENELERLEDSKLKLETKVEDMNEELEGRKIMLYQNSIKSLDNRIVELQKKLKIKRAKND